MLNSSSFNYANILYSIFPNVFSLFRTFFDTFAVCAYYYYLHCALKENGIFQYNYLFRKICVFLNDNNLINIRHNFRWAAIILSNSRQLLLLFVIVFGNKFVMQDIEYFI